jgi:hypothetical protein
MEEIEKPTKEQMKKKAKDLSEFMLEHYGLKIKHGHALEIVSKLYNYKDWNSASALVEKNNHELV